MVRAAYVDKNGVKKGAWTEEEDNKLRAYILRYGHWNWRLLPKFAGLERCGKSCRLRWMNYLKPGLKRGDYSDEERDLIAKLHHELGNKWSAIAEKLPGRTDNDIKNYCHTHIKNREKSSNKLGQQAEVSQHKKHEKGFPGSDVTSVFPKTISRKFKNSEVSSSDVFILESSSPNLSLVSSAVDLELDSSADNEILAGSNPLAMINLEATSNYRGSFSDLLNSGFHENFWSQPFMVDTYSYNRDYNFCLLDEGGLLSPRLSYFYGNAINMF